MSQENVEAFRRAFEAFNRRDIGAVLEEIHPEVEWRPILPVMLWGESTVYRGHEGYREVLRDFFEAASEIHLGISETRDLGDRLVAIGRLRARGKESGAVTESPIAYVVEYRTARLLGFANTSTPKRPSKPWGYRSKTLTPTPEAAR
jgi:ketosteroid isomerase-like protein